MSKGYSNKLNDNTRRVLFEKHQTYYFATSENGKSLKDICAIFGAMIGSSFCTHECKYLKAYDSVEKYIICTKLKEATSNG